MPHQDKVTIARGRFAIPLIRYFIAAALGVQAAQAGTVMTRDGRVLEGAIRIEGEELLISPEGPDPHAGRIPLSDVIRATFAQGKVASPQPPKPTVPPARSIQRRSSRKNPGGIKAEYFSDAAMTKPVFARREENLLYAWSGEPPVPLVPRRFAARWTGRFTMPRYEQATTRTLFLEFEGGVRFWLDGKLQCDTWGDAPQGTSARFPIEAGRVYEFKVEYHHEADEGHARFLMTTIDGQGKRAMKGWYFAPPTADSKAPPEVEFTDPPDGQMWVEPAEVAVSVNAAVRDGSVKAVRVYDRGMLVATLDHPPYRATISHPSAGSHQWVAQAEDDRGMSGLSEPITFYVARMLPFEQNREAPTTAPASWAMASVPSAPSAVAGMGKRAVIDPFVLKIDAESKKASTVPTADVALAKSNAGQISLAHAGGDLRGDSDAFGYVFTRTTGDFELTARLISIECTDTEAQPAIGLMVQGDFRHESPRTSLVVLGAGPDCRAVQLHRAKPGFPQWTQSSVKVPVWLRLIRNGPQIRTYISTDGEQWSPLGSAQTTLPEDLFAGLVACTRDDQVPVKANFDHVTLSPWKQAFEFDAPGILFTDGSYFDQSILPPASVTIDGDSLRVKLAGRQKAIPLANIASILFAPVTKEAAAHMTPGTTGVLLASGDLLDGAVQSLRNGEVTVSSVLFGKRTFNARKELQAIVINGAPPSGIPHADAAFRIKTEGGSIFFATSLRGERDELVAVTAPLDTIRIHQNSIRELSAVPVP